VVLPVDNEEGDVERSVLCVHDFLERDFPFTCRLTIADNAGTGDTWAVARHLAAAAQAAASACSRSLIRSPASSMPTE
jgi:hypothetical protein